MLALLFLSQSPWFGTGLVRSCLLFSTLALLQRGGFVRQIYDHTNEQLAVEWVDEIVRDFANGEMPLEVRRLGRTIKRWRDQIVAWHRSHVSNGPTEAVNNLVKRVKRVAFGMRRFAHYRIRALLYAGRPNWALLDTITPP